MALSRHFRPPLALRLRTGSGCRQPNRNPPHRPCIRGTPGNINHETHERRQNNKHNATGCAAPTVVVLSLLRVFRVFRFVDEFFPDGLGHRSGVSGWRPGFQPVLVVRATGPTSPLRSSRGLGIVARRHDNSSLLIHPTCGYVARKRRFSRGVSSSKCRRLRAALACLVRATLLRPADDGAGEATRAAIAAKYPARCRPLLKKYCLIATRRRRRKQPRPWLRFAAPPTCARISSPTEENGSHYLARSRPRDSARNKPHPSRRREVEAAWRWCVAFLDDECAGACGGDPGTCRMRRLSNADTPH